MLIDLPVRKPPSSCVPTDNCEGVQLEAIQMWQLLESWSSFLERSCTTSKVDTDLRSSLEFKQAQLSHIAYVHIIIDSKSQANVLAFQVIRLCIFSSEHNHFKSRFVDSEHSHGVASSRIRSRFIFMRPFSLPLVISLVTSITRQHNFHLSEASAGVPVCCCFVNNRLWLWENMLQ